MNSLGGPQFRKHPFYMLDIKFLHSMTGRPGYWTMEMKGGSSAPHLACTPCVPLFVHCLIRVEREGLLDYQGRAGIISIVRWNLRPVFGVEDDRRNEERGERRRMGGERERERETPSQNRAMERGRRHFLHCTTERNINDYRKSSSDCFCHTCCNLIVLH